MIRTKNIKSGCITNKTVINLDIAIAHNFDITPFLWSSTGFDLADIILRSKELSVEFRNEFYKRFIESVFDPSEHVEGKGYFIRKIPISTSLNNFYKGNFKITKSDLLKGIEKKTTKAIKKFEKLSDEEKSEEVQIEVKYFEYKCKIDGLKAKLTHMTQRRIDAENVNLMRFLSQSINSSISEEDRKKLVDTDTMLKLFEYYAQNSLEFCRSDDIPEKNKIAIAKNFCSVYKFFGYKENPRIDKMLELCLSIIPELAIDSVFEAGNLNLIIAFTSKILKDAKYDTKFKSYSLNLKLATLVGIERYDECKKIIEEYLHNTTFSDVIRNVVSSINEKKLNQYFSKDEWDNICVEMGLAIPEVSGPHITLFYNEDSFSIAHNLGTTQKQVLYLALLNDQAEIEDIIKKLFDSPYNKAKYTDFILDNIYVSSDPKFVVNVFNILKAYSLDDQIGKIQNAQQLYKVKLKAQRYLEKPIEAKPFIETVSDAKDDEYSASEEEEIDSKELVNEAKDHVNQNTDLLLPAKIIIPKKEEAPELLIHRAYQLQKKLLLEQSEKDFSKITSCSWVVNKIKITYIDDVTNIRPYNINKITTSFGSHLHIQIEPEILEQTPEPSKAKFISASDHWAGSFYNKPGVKALFKPNGTKFGYEIKIMGHGERLFTNKIFKNQEGEFLLKFDKILTHKEVESLDCSLEILEVKSEVEILGSIDEDLA